MKCKVDDCNNSSYNGSTKNQLCGKHYHRLVRNGNTNLSIKYQRIEFKRNLLLEGKSICSSCKEIKLIKDFSKTKTRFGGVSCYCRACKAIKVDGRVHRNNALKRAFGITIEDYEQLLKLQNGVCAICKKPEIALKRKNGPNSNTRPLAVDHDHKTGKIRGLLCTYCNTALGSLKENIQLFQNCMDYLKQYT